MSKELAWIYLFLEHKEAIQRFNADAFKEGFLALLDYAETEEIPDGLSELEMAVFFLLKSGADRAKEHFKTNQERGIKGMQSRWHGTPPKEEEPTEPPEEKSDKKQFVLTAEMKKQIKDEWNKLGLATITGITDARINHLRPLVRDHGLNEVLSTIRSIKSSPFLMGERKDWKITFDWFIKSTNYQKVLEGNYNERGTAEPNDRSDYTEDSYLWENLNGGST